MPNSRGPCEFEYADRCGNTLHVPGTWQGSDWVYFYSLSMGQEASNRAQLMITSLLSPCDPTSLEDGVWQPTHSKWSLIYGRSLFSLPPSTESIGVYSGVPSALPCLFVQDQKQLTGYSRVWFALEKILEREQLRNPSFS